MKNVHLACSEAFDVQLKNSGSSELVEFEFGEAAANFVRNNFYVDDGLISVSSVREAIDLLFFKVVVIFVQGLD